MSNTMPVPPPPPPGGGTPEATARPEDPLATRWDYPLLGYVTIETENGPAPAQVLERREKVEGESVVREYRVTILSAVKRRTVWRTAATLAPYGV